MKRRGEKRRRKRNYVYQGESFRHRLTSVGKSIYYGRQKEEIHRDHSPLLLGILITLRRRVSLLRLKHGLGRGLQRKWIHWPLAMRRGEGRMKCKSSRTSEKTDGGQTIERIRWWRICRLKLFIRLGRLEGIRKVVVITLFIANQTNVIMGKLCFDHQKSWKWSPKRSRSEMITKRNTNDHQSVRCEMITEKRYIWSPLNQSLGCCRYLEGEGEELRKR